MPSAASTPAPPPRRSATKRGRRGLLPGLVTLLGYRRAWLRGDLLAGVTVAAYLVPQVMAYAELAGLPPVAGLWATLAPLALYALLGSSLRLSVGPESTTALMTATAIAPWPRATPAATPCSPRRSPSWSACWPWWRGRYGRGSSPTCCPGPCSSATSPGWPAS